jgi:hypothetical protein
MLTGSLADDFLNGDDNNVEIVELFLKPEKNGI